MIVIFSKDYLQDLFEKGRSKDKKHRYQPDIVRRYQKGILFLKGASSIESLWKIKSLNYEVLTGDKAGLSSIRVNDKYRIEFKVEENKVEENKEEPILTVCDIMDLSNHYR